MNEKIKSLTNLKKRFKLIYIPVFLMMIVGMLMIGITDYITLGFNPTIFRTPSFWINIICTRVGIICLLISIILIKVDKFKETDEQYVASENNINTFYHDNIEYVPTLFQKFCLDYNNKTKVEFYKNNIRKEFSKISPSPHDLDVYYGDNEELKETNEYCNKMKYYDTILSDEYINRVVPKLKIKYPTITESLIFNGCISKYDTVDYVTTHKVWKIVVDMAPRYLLSISAITLASTITSDLKDGINWAIIFKTTLRLFTILSQIYLSYTYAEKYCQEVVLHDIRFRESKVNEYKLWVARQTKLIKDKQNTETKEVTE